MKNKSLLLLLLGLGLISNNSFTAESASGSDSDSDSEASSANSSEAESASESDSESTSKSDKKSGSKAIDPESSGTLDKVGDFLINFTLYAVKTGEWFVETLSSIEDLSLVIDTEKWNLVSKDILKINQSLLQTKDKAQIEDLNNKKLFFNLYYLTTLRPEPVINLLEKNDYLTEQNKASFKLILKSLNTCKTGDQEHLLAILGIDYKTAIEKLQNLKLVLINFMPALIKMSEYQGCDGSCIPYENNETTTYCQKLVEKLEIFTDLMKLEEVFSKINIQEANLNKKIKNLNKKSKQLKSLLETLQETSEKAKSEEVKAKIQEKITKYEELIAQLALELDKSTKTLTACKPRKAKQLSEIKEKYAEYGIEIIEIKDSDNRTKILKQYLKQAILDDTMQTATANLKEFLKTAALQSQELLESLSSEKKELIKNPTLLLFFPWLALKTETEFVNSLDFNEIIKLHEAIFKDSLYEALQNSEKLTKLDKIIDQLYSKDKAKARIALFKKIEEKVKQIKNLKSIAQKINPEFTKEYLDSLSQDDLNILALNCTKFIHIASHCPALIIGGRENSFKSETIQDFRDLSELE